MKIILMCICLTAFHAMAEDGIDHNKKYSRLPLKAVPVSGKILDQNGAPMSGVSIQEKGTGNGTVSATDGSFSLSVSGQGAVLVFSYVGYESREVLVANQTSLSITLSPNVQSQEAIVVVGYGTQKRRAVNGAVAKVDMKTLQNTPATNITQALRGSVAGVQFLDNGRPGQNGSILIRGRRSITAGNDPLVVLDGIIFGGNIGDINPGDIESIEVLKDAASASVYGARAANGVILVTSKKGKSEKPTIRLNTFYGTQGYSNKIKLLSGDRYVQFILDRVVTSGGTLPSNLTKDVIATYLQPNEQQNYLAGRTIDPWDAVSQEAPIQSHELSISGKGESISYFLAGSITKEKGLILNDKSDRISVRANIENKLASWLRTGINAQYVTRNTSGVDAFSTLTLLNKQYFLSGETYRLSPYGKLWYDEQKTSPVLFPQNDDATTNPLWLSSVFNDEQISRNLWANFYAHVDVPFVKGLSYEIRYAPNFRWGHTYQFNPTFRRVDAGDSSRAFKQENEIKDWTLQNIINYNKKFGKDHSLDVILVYERQSSQQRSTTAAGGRFLINSFGWDNLGSSQQAQVAVGSSNIQRERLGSMASVNYGFKNRYFLTLTARRDGSSVFGENNKYGVFPAASAGWVISDEKFMEKNKVVNYLKLRAAYGTVGNESINPYQTSALLGTFYLQSNGQPNLSAPVQYIFGNATAQGIIPYGLGNPNLKWETTITKNIGVDFELWRGRLGGSVEVYDINTKDLLLNQEISAVNGFTTVLTNVGETSNKGIEVTLNTVNVKSGKFQWTSNLTFSYNNNKIVALAKRGPKGELLDDTASARFIGKPINVAYDYVVDGIYQTGDPNIPAGYKPGWVRLRDFNGGGISTTNSADKAIIGSRDPVYRWGFTNNLSYGNFSLAVTLNALTGWVAQYEGLDPRKNQAATKAVNFLDADWWSPTNPSTTRPSLLYASQINHNFYESRDFLRIQNVSLSYDLSGNFFRKMNLKIPSAKIYVSGRNLYTFTKWPGWDPEIGASSFSGDNAYPMPRSFVVGLNVTF